MERSPVRTTIAVPMGCSPRNSSRIQQRILDEFRAVVLRYSRVDTSVHDSEGITSRHEAVMRPEVFQTAFGVPRHHEVPGIAPGIHDRDLGREGPTRSTSALLLSPSGDLRPARRSLLFSDRDPARA